MDYKDDVQVFSSDNYFLKNSKSKCKYVFKQNGRVK